MARRTWTPEQRTNALALYRDHGPAEAARRTGIPEGTIASWANRAGVHTLAPQKTAAAVQASRLRWAERRAVMVEEIGAVAHLALAQTEQAVTVGQGRDAKDFATTMAILVDKAQLLAGDPTARTETVATTELDRQIAGLLDRMEPAA